MLGLLLQRLGYFGRCSFDAVLLDRPGPGRRLHWVECNGRWGGVSLPMTLANRLGIDWQKARLLIVSRREPTRAQTTLAFLDSFSNALFDPGVSDSGAILLCPGRLEAGTGIDLAFVARSSAEVEQRGRELLSQLVA